MPEHTFHTPLPLRLEVSIPAGEIEIETIDGDESTVTVEGDERLLEHLEVRHAGDRVVVALQGKSKFGFSFSLGKFGFNNDSLRVSARLPHGADATVKTASADIEIAGRLGELEVNSVSGDLRVRGEIERDVAIRTVSGDAVLERVGGDLSLQSVSGDVQAERVGGSVDMKSVSGDIRVDSVTAGHVRFSSVSGDVQLGIAAGSLLDVDAGSTSGDLTSDVPLASARPEGSDGSEPTVVLRGRTVSGDLHVFRAG